MFSHLKKGGGGRPSPYFKPLNIAVGNLCIFPIISYYLIIILVRDTFQNRFISLLSSFYGQILTGISVIFLISFGLATNIYEAGLGILFFLPSFMIFLALKEVIKTIDDLYNIAVYFCFGAIFLVVIGFVELYTGLTISTWWSTILGWNIIAFGSPPQRMSSVFEHANFFSLYLVIIVNFCLALIFIDYDKNCLFFQQKKNIYYWLLTICFSLIGLGLSNSRSGWLMIFLTFIAYAIYGRWYKILSLLTVIITAISWASFGNLLGQNFIRQIVPSFIWLRFSDQMFPQRPSPTLRISQWQFCLDLIKDNPLTGAGLRNFDYLYHQATGFHMVHPHNLFLMLGAETGLISLSLFCLLVGLILWRGIKVLLLFELNSFPSLIIFSYLITFGNLIFFNLADLSLFDPRLNILGWIILASIAGVSNTFSATQK